MPGPTGKIGSDGRTIRVEVEKGTMLRRAEGERIDAHAARAIEIAAAGIVACALQFDQARREVSGPVLQPMMA